MDAEVDGFFAGGDEAVAELGLSTYELLLGLLPDAVVTVDDDLIGIGTAPGYKGTVFTLMRAKAHVTLGIAHGVTLPDPSGLMEGKGKVHRHVKLRSPADLARPELRDLLETAIAAHRAR